MKLISFFLRHYWLFLAVIVIISYGQLLLMFPWQDDHALMFKLANITQKAGYLGSGIFGEGPYKYTAFYYYPVYLFFGYKIPIYYFLSLVFYFIASFCVYFVFSNVISKWAGRVAGFLFAAGYIASDGFIRLYNSVGTSLSIIFMSLLLMSYWYFYKKVKTRWYFFAILFYFLAVEFVRYRTHYLIAVIFIFEFLFLAFKRPLLKSLRNSLIRLIPFVAIFYQYFIVWGDSRSGAVGNYLTSLLRGELYKLYSFFSSLTNLIIPDWVSGELFARIPGFALSFFGDGLFVSPALNLLPQQRLLGVIGVFIFLVAIIAAFRIKRNKKVLIFLLFWMFLNLASYAAYLPTTSYETTNRLLAHSFFALVGILALLSQEKKAVYLLVLLFGVGNAFASFRFQTRIVDERSMPAKNFYRQLINHVPSLQKGDVLYFDVADDTKQRFADAFSVAQMPEETALAWLYGIDRYDIRRITQYQDLLDLMKKGSFTDINKNETRIGNIYSFFYSRDKLINTSSKIIREVDDVGTIKRSQIQIEENDEDGINFKEPIESVMPVGLRITLKADPPSADQIRFPILGSQSLSNNEVFKDLSMRNLAFKYDMQKRLLLRNSRVLVSSVWKGQVGDNLVDGRNDTSWRADRVLWTKEGAFLTLDLGKSILFDRFIWINGNASDSPTEYVVEVSSDNKNWREVAQTKLVSRVESNNTQVVSFEPAFGRYVRMVIKKTLSRDSASIAEVWVVPAGFSGLDVKKAEEFLSAPLGNVEDKETFLSTLSQMGYVGQVQVSWFGNKSSSWQAGTDKIIDVKYDRRMRVYKITLPAGGTKIEKLRLTQNQIPGEIRIINITLD